MLNKVKIEEKLKKIGITPPEIVFYEETDSTNTRAKEYAKHSAEKRPAVFIANSQTAGRGRRGRSFVSNSGAGIYISILTYPDEKGADATAATARAAVALSRAIEAVCDSEIKIKWVNDLYLGGKKLAGILTEGEMDENGKIAYQIVGMGINVYKNAISEEIADIATSLESEIKDPPDRSTLAARIIKEFFSETEDCYREYKARSFIIGKTVTVLKLTESYEAKVIDINPDFSLLIERDGKQEKLFTGEISLKI
ncbi:MAG: biotin--[Clostridia bacterium]|nr:biotin--[acetyl-CoA-carboxylase] ligase [Clostridia bacterium]